MAGARFCGLCGRTLVAGVGAGGAATLSRPEPAAMSLFELPLARRPRTRRLVLVLALDAMLAGAGVFLLLAYLNARGAPAAAPIAAAGPLTAADVDIAPARALADDAAADGGLVDRGALIAALGSVASARKDELERCYARATGARAATPALAGAIDLRLAIERDGGLARVSAARNETGSAALAACVVAVVSGWTVPPVGAGGGELGWRLTFRPKGAAR